MTVESLIPEETVANSGDCPEKMVANNVNWEAVDWSDLYPRLVLFAAGKLNRLSWRGEGRRFGAIPGGITENDIVHDAIKKTLSGERVWNRDDNSLFEHLVSVISSMISHLVKGAENRRTLRADEKIAHIPDQSPNPELISIRNAQEQKFLKYLEAKNPKLRQLAELILYDPAASNTPELMVKLDLSLQRVESLKRSLRRAAEAFSGEDPHSETDADNLVSFDIAKLKSAKTGDN